MYHKSLKNKEKIFAVAPMMDWTDRHCRYFHRQLSNHAELYTEMVTADAVIQGDRQKLLAQHPDIANTVLQIGGSDPDKLAQASEIGADFGYREINLNVGCPSDRVQTGKFGACLMLEPKLVGQCVKAMVQKSPVPISVKCRIGVDNQDINQALDDLANEIWAAGAERLWVHARKAWLQGLSPKQNRDVPPLDYDRVYRLKAENPDRFVGINGGIATLSEAQNHLRFVDGVMLGRAAYHNPALLLEVDKLIYGDQTRPPTMNEVKTVMKTYAQQHMENGHPLHPITRHMMGLFAGQPGGRHYRRILSQVAPRNSGLEIFDEAFDVVCAEQRLSA